MPAVSGQWRRKVFWDGGKSDFQLFSFHATPYAYRANVKFRQSWRERVTPPPLPPLLPPVFPASQKKTQRPKTDTTLLPVVRANNNRMPTLKAYRSGRSTRTKSSGSYCTERQGRRASRKRCLSLSPVTWQAYCGYRNAVKSRLNPPKSTYFQASFRDQKRKVNGVRLRPRSSAR